MSKQICDSEFPWCPADAKAGDFYKLRLKDLSPTQFAVGKAEIQMRGDEFSLVDHHHLARGLHEALHEKCRKDLCVYVKVLGNGSSLEEPYFWKTMHQDNWVYLFDENGGGPRAPATLPKHIKDLKFDPYRSLAWIVREHHGYLKNNTPFSEFKWANFFRTHILLDQDLLAGRQTFDEFAFVVDEHGTLELNDDGKEVIDEALFLASSAEAWGLPGFRGPSA